MTDKFNIQDIINGHTDN